MVIGILVLGVCLCRLQNSIDTGVLVTTAVVYGISVECYPLQAAVTYPVRAMTGNEMEHDTVTIRHLQCHVVYFDCGLFRRTSTEVTRGQHDLFGKTHGFRQIGRASCRERV